LQHLQLKEPDHFPNDPYNLKVIYKAAHYVLHGMPSTPPTTVTTATTSALPFAPTKPEVKTEDVTALPECINETVAKLLAVQARPARPPTDRAGQPMNCHFCGDLGHLGCNCGVVADYITQGKCKHNGERLIVFPLGAFIPHDILGRWFKDQLDEWHSRNPSQFIVSSQEEEDSEEGRK
jgi:hypothetical protein